MSSGGCSALSNTITLDLITATEPAPTLTDGQVTVYPNPTSGDCWVKIDVDDNQPISLHLVDVLGRSVRYWNISASPNMALVRVSMPTADGLYLLRVETERGAVVKKLVRGN